MKNISKYGEIQRKVRKERDMSIRELSERSGVSHSYLSQIENGTRDTPSEDVIKKIAKGLDYDYFTLATLSEVITENDINYETLQYYIRDLEQQYHSLLTTRSNLEDIVSDINQRNELVPKDLINNIEEIDKQAELLAESIYDAEGALRRLENNHEDYELMVFDDKVEIPYYFLRFKFPKYKKVDLNGTTTGKMIKIHEARKEFLSLENILTMEEDISLNGKILSKEKKRKALKILKLIFENENSN